MSTEYNVKRTTGVMGGSYGTVMGKKEPLAHPQNCKHECPYGRDRAFCFPCMAKIMGEYNTNKKKDE